ncbi:hypothetical protein N9J42_00335 [bacterium]|nr:hypothetical protein [bacterium]
MADYFFFIKLDKTKEKISKGKYQSLEDAQNSFAKSKRLPLSEFNRLFKVEKYDSSRP